MRDKPYLPDSIETIPAALAFWAVRTPAAPALRTTGGYELCYSALQDAIDRIANRLLTAGIAREERVALILPVGFDMCVALLGTIASAVAVPLNPASSASELTRDLERLRPALVVTSGPPAGMARDVA